MKRYDSGQSLIEIVLALAVVVVVITGITFAITSSLKNATFSKNQNLASTYAKQGMEIVRQIRDRNWIEFRTPPGGGSQCLPENSTVLVQRQGPDCKGEGDVGIFIRHVTLNNNHPDCVAIVGSSTKVTVSVRWSDKECPSSAPNNYCHRVELVSCFIRSNAIPAP